MENKRPLGWTTLEEAKKLVEAGIDPNTADMLFENHYGETIVTVKPWTIKGRSIGAHIFPCWSLGALKKVVPDCIIKGDVYFNFHSIYSQATYYRATYEDVCFNKRIDLGCHKTEIALFVEIICWLIRNGYIKKSE